MENIITLHSLFSLSWDEWGSIVAVLTAIVIILRWLMKRTKDDIVGPLIKQMKDLAQTMEGFTDWQLKAAARLEKGDKKFVVHDEELKDHERRIGKLEEMKYGHKNHW